MPNRTPAFSSVGLSFSSMLLVSLFFIAFVLAGCEPTGKTALKFGWFYRFIVELSYNDEPLNIEVIVACGSQARHILGEGRSVRAIRAPYIYGVRTKDGHGVLVQTPDICYRDVTKDPIPADFLPIVFWAPDANNLEFLIAYLHERAYDQPVSKLKFHRATVTEATQADHEAWRATKWKDNIVPIGDRDSDQLGGVSYFRGEGFFPRGDPRNQSLLRMECHSYIRLLMPEAARARLRERWPAERPRYWLLDWKAANALLTVHRDEIRRDAQSRDLGSDVDVGLTSFWEGWGILRPSGVGHLGRYPNERVAGKALRIPYRVETGYPWAGDRLFTQSTIDLHADTEGGADHGFAYCFRDIYAHYFRNRATGERKPLDHRFFVDGQLIGTQHNVTGRAPGAVIVESDEYLWKSQHFTLTHELARMQ